MPKLTVRDIEVEGKRVLVRVDFNVPLDPETGAITDDRRIEAALPTIRYLRERGARVILCSHLGRPDGTVREELRLEPVARRLSELLGASIGYVRDCIGPEVTAAVANLKKGEVLLLENMRFHAAEERNDPRFAAELAKLADVYVNDAFGTAHRAHASTEGVAHHLPAVAGFLMEAELQALGTCLDNPRRPFAAVVGGAKVSSKIAVLEALAVRADLLLIGGGMACTFLKAQGIEVGDSLVEEDQLETAGQQMRRLEGEGRLVLLSGDAVVADRFDAAAAARVVDIAAIEPGWRMLDIGPRTVDAFREALAPCHTVLWNGPMGVFEFPRFAEGTLALARALAELDATTVVGGGETALAVEQAGVADRITHVSTGGGAALEFIEGRTLPGVAALLDRKEPA